MRRGLIWTTLGFILMFMVGCVSLTVKDSRETIKMEQQLAEHEEVLKIIINEIMIIEEMLKRMYVPEV